ncbi:MAG: hypothetical protein QM652_12920 [Legionella sp.]|uniref:hypothetical protein n=1 Tax=Legionella sp. TaxID=459 RepID=UPI0039E6C356
MSIKTDYFSKSKEKILSQREFLSLKEPDKTNIALTEIIPPSLRKKGLGTIKVHYKRPVFKG